MLPKLIEVSNFHQAILHTKPHTQKLVSGLPLVSLSFGKQAWILHTVFEISMAYFV